MRGRLRGSWLPSRRRRGRSRRCGPALNYGACIRGGGRLDEGVPDTHGPPRQCEGAFNFLIALGGISSASVVKFVSKNLLGWEVDLSNLRKKIPQLLNLPPRTFVELIDPSDAQLGAAQA